MSVNLIGFAGVICTNHILMLAVMFQRLVVILGVAGAVTASAAHLSGTEAARAVACRLDAAGDVAMTLRYGVLLPSADDEIVYDVDIWARPAADGDTLCHSDYLIEWKLPAPSGLSTGFSAYAGGNHYRYRDGRLQEYHYDWDSVPMTTAHGGVQSNAQFAGLTPAGLAARLRAMAADTTYRLVFTPDSVYSRRPADILRAVQSVGGYDCRLETWVLDPDTSLPRVIEVETNPASITEQTVTVRYDSIATGAAIPRLDEEGLVGRYPDVFATCRESNFAVTSLPGKRLPTFSAPTTTGERYTHHRDESFAVPTVIWLLDPAVASTPDVIEATRRAVDTLPLSADVIYAFVTNNTDAIDEIITAPRPGEHLLMSARPLARDCGVTAYPTAIIVRADGTVSDVIIGMNKELTPVVMQLVTAAR